MSNKIRRELLTEKIAILKECLEHSKQPTPATLEGVLEWINQEKELSLRFHIPTLAATECELIDLEYDDLAHELIGSLSLHDLRSRKTLVDLQPRRGRSRCQMNPR